MNLSRRRLFGFGAALVAAPAIVRVSALMPISVPKSSTLEQLVLQRLEVAERKAYQDLKRLLDEAWSTSTEPRGFGISQLLKG